LSAREKAIVAVGAGFVGVLGFWLGVWEPVKNHLDLLDRKLKVKQAEYREIRKLAVRFESLSRQIQGIEANLKRSKSFSIQPHLELLAKRQQLQDRIVQMKPKGGEITRYYREKTVEIEMQKVRLPELVRYLFQVEDSKETLRIKQLQIDPRFDDKDLLRVRFQVSVFEPVEAG
jgi:general secretion pathway protein M